MAKSSKAANTARLKKMHSRAKAIVKKHPKKKYQAALKEAGREMRGKSTPKKRKAAPKKKRAKVGAKRKVTRRVKKVGSVSYRGGSVKIGAMSISQARHAVEEKLAWKMLAKSQAKNKTEGKAAQKDITALKTKLRQLNALS